MDNFIRTVVEDEDRRLRLLRCVERAAEQARRKPLIELDSIPISKAEIDAVNALPSGQHQKLGFTMLVLAKYFDLLRETNNHWVNLTPKDVFELACLNLTVFEQAMMYSDLIEAGFLQYSRKVGNNNARVLIIDGDDVEIEVTDFRKVGLVIAAYNGEPYSRCEKCGILFRQNRFKNLKYCNDCRTRKNKVAARIYNCIDCGKECVVVGRNHKSIRCPECQIKKNADAVKVIRSKALTNSV